MANGGNAASGLGGFAEGFSKSFFAAKDRKRQQERDDELKQFGVLKDALHTASQRGDTNAIAHIFRSMEEFTTAGRENKGKKKKEAQGGILSHFADMLEGGQQTPESQQAVQQNQEMIQQGTPELAERPREALTKPLLMTNKQLGQQDIEQDVAKQQAMMPGAVKEFGLRQQEIMNRQKEVRAQDVTNRLGAKLTELDAKGKIDANKRISQLTAATGDPEAAKELYLEEINAGIHQKEAQANLSNIRSSYIEKDYDERVRKNNAQLSHWNNIDARAREASLRGDKSFEHRVASSGSPELRKSVDADLRQMGMIKDEILKLESITTGIDKNDPQVQAYKRNLEDLDKQYTTLRDNVQQKQSKLDSIAGEVESTKKSFGSKKMMNSNNGRKDESGYKIGQEIDGGSLGYPGQTLIYKGLDSSGQAIFRKKKK